MSIRSLVENSGKSRTQIQKEVGFSQGYLSLLESGERRVGRTYLKQLATALGVPPGELRPDLVNLLDVGADQ